VAGAAKWRQVDLNALQDRCFQCNFWKPLTKEERAQVGLILQYCAEY
jgi:hypothetical protein